MFILTVLVNGKMQNLCETSQSKVDSLATIFLGLGFKVEIIYRPRIKKEKIEDEKMNSWVDAEKIFLKDEKAFI